MRKTIVENTVESIAVASDRFWFFSSSNMVRTVFLNIGTKSSNSSYNERKERSQKQDELDS